jgi:hypothetical protein
MVACTIMQGIRCASPPRIMVAVESGSDAVRPEPPRNTARCLSNGRERAGPAACAILARGNCGTGIVGALARGDCVRRGLDEVRAALGKCTRGKAGAERGSSGHRTPQGA